MSKGKSLGDCRTCGSEIVEFSNDGVMGDGVCESCEGHRYDTQPELLRAAQLVLERRETGDLAEAVRQLADAVAKAA